MITSINQELIFLSLSIALILLLNFLYIKKDFLIHKTFNFQHKVRKDNDNVKIPLSGGLYILISLLIINIFNNFYLFNFFLYSVFFYFIGYLSDINSRISPKIRFIIMNVITFMILINAQLIIDKIDIKIIDFFLKFNLLSLAIFTLAIVSIINGTNFIDGNNGNCIAYFLLIFFILIYRSDEFLFNYNDIFLIRKIIIFLLVFFILNFFNKNYLGDNGSYILGFFTSIYFVHLFAKYSISSIFLICLLIYPFIEVLFSIIRKYLEGKNPFYPDNLHLHQLIENRIFSKVKTAYANNLTTFIILIFNIPFYYIMMILKISKVNFIQILSAYIISYVIFYCLIRLDFFAKKKN